MDIVEGRSSATEDLVTQEADANMGKVYLNLTCVFIEIHINWGKQVLYRWGSVSKVSNGWPWTSTGDAIMNQYL